MSVFHRLENPPGDYFLNGEAGPLPSVYDYLNNSPAASSGTADGNRALFNPKKPGGGFNGGTYFVGWREEGVSAVVNRALHALGENTDYLEGLLRRRQGVHTRVSKTFSGGETFYDVVGTIWCGSGGEQAAELVQLLTSNEDEILKVVGSTSTARVIANDIQVTGGGASVIGTGWVTNPRVNLSAAIPAMTSLIHYVERQSLATMAADSLSHLERPERTPYEVQKQLLLLQGPLFELPSSYTLGAASSVADLAYMGLNGRYRRGTADSGFNAAKFNIPGEGAVIYRDGRSVEVRSDIDETYVNGKRTLIDPLNAAISVRLRDKADPSSTVLDDSGVGSIGYVAYAPKWTVKGFDDKTAAIASFMGLAPHYNAAVPTADATKVFTHVPEATAGTIEFYTGIDDRFLKITLGGTGTYPDAFWWKDVGSGVLKTAVVAKKDLIEVTYALSGVTYTNTFVVLALYADGAGVGLSNRAILVTPLDGGDAVGIGGGVVACTVTWISTSFYVGNGARPIKAAFDSATLPTGTNATGFDFDGLFIGDQPLETDNQTTAASAFYNPRTTGATLTVGAREATKKAFAIGQYNSDPKIAIFEETGYILGDGTVHTLTIETQRVRRSAIGLQTVPAAGSSVLTIDFSVHDRVLARVTGTRLVSKMALNLGAVGINQGDEIILMLHHDSGTAGVASFASGIFPFWSTLVNGSETINTVFFESTGDADLSGATGFVDIFRFINLGTLGTPKLLATVSRVGQGAL